MKGKKRILPSIIVITEMITIMIVATSLPVESIEPPIVVPSFLLKSSFFY